MNRGEDDGQFRYSTTCCRTPAVSSLDFAIQVAFVGKKLKIGCSTTCRGKRRESLLKCFESNDWNVYSIHLPDVNISWETDHQMC
jgi:hypothetical protein